MSPVIRVCVFIWNQESRTLSFIYHKLYHLINSIKCHEFCHLCLYLTSRVTNSIIYISQTLSSHQPYQMSRTLSSVYLSDIKYHELYHLNLTNSLSSNFVKPYHKGRQLNLVALSTQISQNLSSRFHRLYHLTNSIFYISRTLSSTIDSCCPIYSNIAKAIFYISQTLSSHELYLLHFTDFIISRTLSNQISQNLSSTFHKLNYLTNSHTLDVSKILYSHELYHTL